MQFGKTYVNESVLSISEDAFYKLVKGRDLGGMCKTKAWELFKAEQDKHKPKAKKVVKEE